MTSLPAKQPSELNQGRIEKNRAKLDKQQEPTALTKTGPKQAIAPQQIDGFAAPDVPAPIVPPQAVYDATYQETAQLAQSLGDVRKQAVVDALKDNAAAIKRDADSFRTDNLQGFADWLVGG